jgi:hypothetical protein
MSPSRKARSATGSASDAVFLRETARQSFYASENGQEKSATGSQVSFERLALETDAVCHSSPRRRAIGSQGHFDHEMREHLRPYALGRLWRAARTRGPRLRSHLRHQHSGQLDVSVLAFPSALQLPAADATSRVSGSVRNAQASAGGPVRQGVAQATSGRKRSELLDGGTSRNFRLQRRRLAPRAPAHYRRGMALRIRSTIPRMTSPRKTK